MEHRRIELIEHGDARRSRPLVDGAPMLASAGSRWTGLPLELVRTPERGELRRFESRHAMASICLGGRQHVEVRVGSTRHRALMTPGRVSIGAGGREIERCTWRGGQSLMVVELSDEALVAMLGEERGGATFELDERFGVADAPLVALGEAMRLEVQAGCPSGALYAQSLSLAFALQLRRRAAGTSREPPVDRSGLSAGELSRVREYVDAHLARPLTLVELAGVTGLSVSHFARQFKRSTGLTPYRHVLERRIERAVRLLRDDDESIAGIALATGFADQSHLTSAFRKAIGQTPARFRRRENAERCTATSTAAVRGSR